MHRGQRVKAARTIRGGQVKIAKGTAERFSVRNWSGVAG